MTDLTPTPTPGDPFPTFALPDAEGRTHRLADYAGRYVVLYAYPKDDTPGCTREACDFRDSALLKAHGAAILGVSRDDADSHRAFGEKYGLPFPLLTDADAVFLRTVGAFGPKNSFGKVTEGVKRTTFLIDPDGRLIKAWPTVQVEGHADAVAAAIDTDREARGA
ncbi:peroxiredoxin [Deinococcus sp. YIM 134068]|uniref:peroxiredoxin n=1 Tax=Deinococcus lichenicola TaxID=3118910 RepID=UPI002F9477A7